MQSLGLIARSLRLVRVLKNPSPAIFTSSPLDEFVVENAGDHGCFISPSCRFHSAALFSGNDYCYSSSTELDDKNYVRRIQLLSTVNPSRLFSSEATNSNSADTVKDIHDKILNCVAEIRTAPPNAFLWSLVAKCSTHEDIELLFDILQKLRVFRLSNLRIPDDFNSALCREVTKACIRSGALDFGEKALWKHNAFGLTPDIGSAHQLLLHAKEQSNVKLMVKVLTLIRRNDLPLQPGTADIVFSICLGADRFDLMTKYGTRFVTSGVKLRKTSFDMWMEFAAKKGDVESLWKVENWRSEALNKQSLSTGFSCAKGFLLEHKPESAAAMIQVLYETLGEAKREKFVTELQKLAGEWAMEVIKQQEKGTRKAFASTLHKDMSAMMNALRNLGVKVDVIIEDFIEEEEEAAAAVSS